MKSNRDIENGVMYLLLVALAATAVNLIFGIEVTRFAIVIFGFIYVVRNYEEIF